MGTSAGSAARAAAAALAAVATPLVKDLLRKRRRSLRRKARRHRQARARAVDAAAEAYYALLAQQQRLALRLTAIALHVHAPLAWRLRRACLQPLLALTRRAASRVVVAW